MSADDPKENVTVLLGQMEGGSPDARDALFAIVYDELRRMARGKMRRERPGQTLQTTALVNEAYLRLVSDPNASWRTRAHFFGTAAEAMRRILIERARKRRAVKHGGDLRQVSLEDDVAAAEDVPDILELDRALTRLESQDPRKATVVKLHYLLGFTIDETAELAGVASRTVDKDWRLAKAWLKRAMSDSSNEAQR